VKLLVGHLSGEAIKKRVDTGLTLVTPENIDEPGVHRQLLPDLDEYLN
jgi:ribose transport system substrate-binding protein